MPCEIVLGVGASHTTLMNTRWDQVDHLPRAHEFRNGLRSAREILKAARPDAVIVVGSNHFRGFWLDLIPSFTIGVGEVISSGEHGTPAGRLRTDSDLAQHICNEMIEAKIDLAFSARLTVDHGISHAVQWIVGVDQIPIVPIVVNCFAHPLPTLERCLAFGAVLREALLSAPGARRIAVIATGGLSHRLPFPDWRSPLGEDEEFLVESWRNGRGHWEEYEQRRRQIVVNAPAQLNEDFDLAFLRGAQDGDLKGFPTRVSDKELEIRAGNGANEVRAWLIMAEALDHPCGEILAYAPMPEWLTGMGVAVLTPPSHP